MINFEKLEDIERLMRTSNLELVNAIVTDQSESLRQLANVIDRDYRGVHRNLKELESLGVVVFEETGRSKKPILRGGVENIDVSIRFPFDAGANGTSSAAP